MEFHITTGTDLPVVQQCVQVAQENHLSNGGTLRRLDLCASAQYLVYAQDQTQIIGYLALKENYFQQKFPNEKKLRHKKELYLSQIAIKKDYQHQGLGTQLIDFALQHAQGFDILTSNARPTNRDSFRFHQKLFPERLADYGLSQSFLLPIDPERTRTSFATVLAAHQAGPKRHVLQPFDHQGLRLTQEPSPTKEVPPLLAND